MGSHYATIIVEESGELVDEFIIAAPSSLEPGKLIRFFSKNKTGNNILEKLTLSEKALVRMLKVFKRLRLINEQDFKILFSEIGTAELRFNFYACFTYLRFLEMDEQRLLVAIGKNNIKSIFIFGNRDKTFPPKIGEKFIRKLEHCEVVILDEGHEMIKKDFVTSLTKLLS
jgi:hypothetical protein